MSNDDAWLEPLYKQREKIKQQRAVLAKFDYEAARNAKIIEEVRNGKELRRRAKRKKIDAERTSAEEKVRREERELHGTPNTSNVVQEEISLGAGRGKTK